MKKIIKYTFKDLSRSKWVLSYLLFYLITGFLLLFMNSSLSSAILTLLNLVIILVPLIGTVFGVMYTYSSREFTELLMAQPVKRETVFLGQYLGISLSLAASLVIGLGLPFLIYGVVFSSAILDFVVLLVVGIFLTFIFTGLAIYISMKNENRIKGFGLAILLWLFLTVLYDGLFLLLLVTFNEYPLEIPALVASVVNPVDLSRILILLKLDISALLGYTGAVFKDFMGSGKGMILSFLLLAVWTVLPALGVMRIAKKKDF